MSNKDGDEKSMICVYLVDTALVVPMCLEYLLYLVTYNVVDNVIKRHKAGCNMHNI